MLWAGEDTPTRNPDRQQREGRLTSPADDVPILVVDDDANFCTTVSRALAGVPFRPFSVRSAADALRFLARAEPFHDAPRPAFVVLDFNRPDLDAPAVLADVPVLMVTGSGSEEVAVEAMKCGAGDYVVKHATYAKVVPGRVRGLLGRRALARFKPDATGHGPAPRELTLDAATRARFEADATNCPPTGIWSTCAATVIAARL